MNGFTEIFYRFRARRLRRQAGRLFDRAEEKFGRARALDARADVIERALAVKRAEGLKTAGRGP